MKVLDNVLKNDPNYFPALNNLAYSYALGGRADLAPPLMDRYVAALPGQPNPQDSYARDSSDARRFSRRARPLSDGAPNFDPVFSTSQVGIASTYALMGDEDRARFEYFKSIDMAKDRTDRWTIEFCGR